jgi:hypothetical protein
VLEYRNGILKVLVVGGRLDVKAPPKATLEVLGKVGWVGAGKFEGAPWKKVKKVGRKKASEKLEFWELDNAEHSMSLGNRQINFEIFNNFIKRRVFSSRRVNKQASHLP